jgi:hypothetical protein
MDDAERFVRDATSFSGHEAAKPGAMLNVARLAIRRIESVLGRLRKSDGPDDPFSYVGAPVKPKPPRLKSAVRLPLP